MIGLFNVQFNDNEVEKGCTFSKENFDERKNRAVNAQISVFNKE